ncbi:MAG: ATP-binding protein [Nitrospira sp.]|nr:ATP-binding protein [Nitrospira sp.]
MPTAEAATRTWHEMNQRSLMTEVSRVRAAIAAYVASRSGHNEAEALEHGEDLQASETHQTDELTALDALCVSFGLSAFERDVLLLAAGMELDAGFASACAAAQGDPRRASPTFSLALAALAQSHWSALIPTAPLRRWRLVEIGQGETLLTSPLRIDERILHYLTGLSYVDERLAGLVDAVESENGHRLIPAHQLLVDRIAAFFSPPNPTQRRLHVQLCGDDGLIKRQIAAAVSEAMGCRLYRLAAPSLPAAPQELDMVLRLWTREAVLTRSVLLIEHEGTDASEVGRDRVLSVFLDGLGAPLILSVRERREVGHAQCLTLEVEPPSQQERRQLWTEVLGRVDPVFNEAVESVSRQFHVSTSVIREAGVALSSMEGERDGQLLDEQEQANRLWEICRRQARTRLDELAQRIEPSATWEDLVLPEPQRQVLQEITMHVRHRHQVYETWGFAVKGSRGLGISALFAGASGTGKTMAAEVLAHTLRLDLYRIDLSQVISKYIGETEKNLRKVFDAAEGAAAILLFDEADALFGKRSEVKDSHDRYANVEVSYLLQRMEAYRGLAILTTNMKGALDAAFLRRIRFVVQFPFPDPAQRTEIWRRIFPKAVPTEGLDWERLARLNVAGGHIRNIAMNATFLAADEGASVTMRHLLQAARGEYAKLEKPLTEAEIARWA